MGLFQTKDMQRNVESLNQRQSYILLIQVIYSYQAWGHLFIWVDNLWAVSRQFGDIWRVKCRHPLSERHIFLGKFLGEFFRQIWVEKKSTNFKLWISFFRFQIRVQGFFSIQFFTLFLPIFFQTYTNSIFFKTCRNAQFDYMIFFLYHWRGLPSPPFISRI